MNRLVKPARILHILLDITPSQSIVALRWGSGEDMYVLLEPLQIYGPATGLGRSNSLSGLKYPLIQTVDD